MNATVTCFVGTRRLSEATIWVNGEVHQLDGAGSAVVRLPPGELVVGATVEGVEYQRTYAKHGSTPRFVVDFEADDSDHPFTGLLGLVGDRFRIDRVVARAPTGTVVKARDLQNERDVALRAPSDELSAQEEAHQVFVVEAKNLLQIEHPNLLALYDVLTFRGRSVLVTEWVEGDTLESLIRSGRVGPQQAWEIVLPVASGVAQLHREDIVHRDLHAANIIVQPGGGPKLIDLGLARSLADVYLGSARVRDTREHYAPEQFQGLHVTPATDVYQLTLLFSQCWSGERSKVGKDQERGDSQEEAAILNAPEPLPTLVARGFDKDPRRRFVDAQAWFREFSGAQELLAVREERVEANTRTRPVLLALGVLVGLAVVAAIVLLSSAEKEKVLLGGPNESGSAEEKVGAADEDVVEDGLFEDGPLEDGDPTPAVPDEESAQVVAPDAGAVVDAGELERSETVRLEPGQSEEREREVREQTTEVPRQGAAKERLERQAERPHEDSEGDEAEDVSEKSDSPRLLEVEDGTGDSILLPVE